MEVRKSGQLLDEKELEDDVFHLETLPGTSYLFVVSD